MVNTKDAVKMISKFMDLEPEKRERILNASINEFAIKGFKNASTNEIVKEAGISKGLIFHYFKNKKQLYLFLYDYLMGILKEEYFQKPWVNEKDFLEKMRMASLTKLELFRKYPLIFKFFLTAYSETDGEVRNEVADRNQKLREINLPRVYDNVDLSNVKDGVDHQKAINLIAWALEGYANDKIPKFKTMGEKEFSDMVTEFAAYLEILKQCFFKG
jgi:AcrR family transcriptional regulator